MTRALYTLIVTILTLTVLSCNLRPMEDGGNINDYIYPYLVFTPDENGEGYSVTIADGAELESVYIPSEVTVDGKTYAVTTFRGFQNPDDAKALTLLTLASSDTFVKAEVFTQAGNLTSLNVAEETEDEKWGELPSPEKEGMEFDGWYIRGTDVSVKKGDRMISGFTVIEPRWREHSLRYTSRRDATCTANGTEAHYSCLSCGRKYRDAKALEEVKVGDLVIAASHNLDYIKRIEPTCTGTGRSVHYRCTVCQMTFSDSGAKNYLDEKDTVIAAEGHSPVHIEAKAPTCTESGYTEYWKCEVCPLMFSDPECREETEETAVVSYGHSFVFRYGEKIADGHWKECTRCGATEDSTPHTFGEGKITAYPTHEKSGTITKKCTECNAEAEEDIEPVGDHIWKEKGETASTCEERGYTTYVCTVSGCTASYNGSYKNPDGHSLSPHVRVNATCTSDGIEAYWQCLVCLKLFSDSEGKKNIASPVTIERTGHSIGKTYSIDEEKNVHYRSCTNDGCDYREEAGHTFSKITSSRIPITSQTCTKGAVYRESCICGKEGEKTFEDGKGIGHTEATVHLGKSSNCRETGIRTYYTCSRMCCSDRFYLDENLSEEVTYDSLIIPAAEHAFEEKKFTQTEDGHTYICDGCGEGIRTEKHTRTYVHDYYEHHWECSLCGYKAKSSRHVLSGEEGKRICTECGYSETESQNEGGSFTVQSVNREPEGHIVTEKNGTQWTFTLVSTNDNAPPDTYVWHLDGKPVEGERTNTYTLEATGKRTYRIMCVFRSGTRYSSASLTITGGE